MTTEAIAEVSHLTKSDNARWGNTRWGKTSKASRVGFTGPPVARAARGARRSVRAGRS